MAERARRDARESSSGARATDPLPPRRRRPRSPRRPSSICSQPTARLVAPSHPGFGHSPDANTIDTVDDLALSLPRPARAARISRRDRDRLVAGRLDRRGDGGQEQRTHGRGSSSWRRSASRSGDRETRDIPDIFALPPDEVTRLQYRDPARAARRPRQALGRSAHRDRAQSRGDSALRVGAVLPQPEAQRWLHRISVPTLLLWGADDRFVTAAYYGAAYQGAIPGARFETIDGAGHFPHIEQPRRCAERIRAVPGGAQGVGVQEYAGLVLQ